MNLHSEEVFKIQIEGTGKQFFCSTNEFILNAMMRADCGPMSHGCCGGGCGICKMRIVSGRVKIEKPMSREHVTQTQEASGLALICCVKPCSDITLAQVW